MIGNRSTHGGAAQSAPVTGPLAGKSKRGRRAWVVGCLSALALGAVGVAHADLTGPSPKDRQITIQVTQFLRRAHLTQHRLDDEISRRWLANFLKTLDPMKVYFYQSDIDNFKKSENDLDNMANRGDISFAYTIFKDVYLKRVAERSQLAVELLNVPHDFTVDEVLNTDPKKTEYAKDFAGAREIWRKRVKYDILQQKVDNKLDDVKAREKLARRYHSLVKRLEQTSNDELLEMYLTAMTTAFDPHTSYMAPETLDNFRILMSLQLDGIGASLRSEDGNTIVTEVVPGGAAQKHGKLKPEDIVIGVGQNETGEIEDVVDQKLGDVVSKIRGKRGTIVRLKVIPAGKAEPVVYNITRDKIELKGSEARGEVIEFGKKADGSPYKIGVINLPSFYMDMVGAQKGVEDFKSTTRDVLKLIDDPKTGFKAQGVDVMIMDLRQNGGGSLSEAIKLTGLFIDQGPVVQVKDWEGEISEHDDEDLGVAWDRPLVVLTSKFSASASEIFAGAIQDYNRGLIVGDTSTHGKGTVQSLLDIGEQINAKANEFGALKLTMQQFYRPNGHSTQREGVKADVVLPSVIDHMDVGEVDLDYAVPFDQIEPAPFKAVNDVNEAIRKQLGVQSAQRIQASPDFQKIAGDVAKFLARKDKKEVSLNEAKFREDRSSLSADKNNPESEEPMNSYDRPVVERDAYFNETLQITLDYLKMMSLARTR